MSRAKTPENHALAISCDRFSQFRQTGRIKEDATVRLEVRTTRQNCRADDSLWFADCRHATVAILSTFWPERRNSSEIPFKMTFCRVAPEPTSNAQLDAQVVLSFSLVSLIELWSTGAAIQLDFDDSLADPQPGRGQGRTRKSRTMPQRFI